MIVRSLYDLTDSDRHIKTPNWESRRILLKRDGMGFSLHETIIYKGAEITMCYKNHLEAVLCVEGEGEIEDLRDGTVHQIRPGTMYALNEHEQHILRSRKQLRMICVFNPPVTGQEVHNEEGAYPAEHEMDAAHDGQKSEEI